MTRLTLAFLLTAVLLAGCGDRPDDNNPQRPDPYNSPHPSGTNQSGIVGVPKPRPDTLIPGPDTIIPRPDTIIDTTTTR